MKRFLFSLVCILGAYNLIMSQTTVTGTVTDVEGDALIGANILVVGTSVGTITDFDGNYEIEVPDGANVLQFSYTGFETQEVTIDGRTVINLELAAGQLLEEVVVTALGIERSKKSLGYATQEIEPAEVLKVKDINFMNSHYWTNGSHQDGFFRIFLRCFAPKDLLRSQYWGVKILKCGLQSGR